MPVNGEGNSGMGGWAGADGGDAMSEWAYEQTRPDFSERCRVRAHLFVGAAIAFAVGVALGMAL
jgi:hypothetical protein